MTGQPDFPTDSDGKRIYSGKELRMARRKARRLGLNAENGKQAIEMLEARGIAIDDNEVTLAESARAAEGGALVTQDQNQKENLPAKKQQQNTQVQTKNDRAKEVQRLENKIRKRREKRFRRMLRRFFVYVLVPTFMMWFYYAQIATPLYVSKTEMKIESASSAGSLAESFLGGSPLGDNSESVGVESFLHSRLAYEKVERDYNFSEIFMTEDIDRLRRLPEDATPEEKFANYRKHVKIGFDNTDGVLRLEVRMFTPDQARDVSELLIGYAEENLDDTTERVRNEGVNDAEALLQTARENLTFKQDELIALQRLQGSFAPSIEVETQGQIIADARARLALAEERLASLEANPSPNQARVQSTKNEIAFLTQRLEELNARSTQDTGAGETILEMDLAMRFAQEEVAQAAATVALAQENLQAARIEARTQRKYLVTNVRAETSFAPVYPKTLQAVLASFFVIFAFYLFVVMTIEVLKEQASV